MNEKEVNKLILKEVLRSWKTIIIVAIICVIIAGIITFLIPKRYQSVAIVYPTSSNSMLQEAKNSYFGYEFQADRLIQLFESQKMRQTIVDRFNLIQYYELDTNSKNWRYELNKNYGKDITFTRTKFISVKVQANTKSPELSSNIVEHIIQYIDTIRKDILYENLYALEKSLMNKVSENQKETDSLLYFISVAQGNVKPNVLAKNLISKLEESKRNGNTTLGDEIIWNAAKNNYSFEMAKLINEYYQKAEILYENKKKLEEVSEKTSVPFPRIYIVSSPFPDYRKSSPSFLINLSLGFFLGILISILFIAIRQWTSFFSNVSE